MIGSFQGFIVFGPKNDDVQANYALLSSRPRPFVKDYALHPSNGINHVTPLYKPSDEF